MKEHIRYCHSTFHKASIKRKNTFVVIKYIIFSYIITPFDFPHTALTITIMLNAINHIIPLDLHILYSYL